MLYQLYRLSMTLLVLVSPARLAMALPAIPTEVHAATASNPVPYNLTLDTKQTQPVVIHAAPKPNFDIDVIAPLKAAQAAEAAQAAAAQAAEQAAVLAQASRAAVSVVAPAGDDDAFAALRACEAGGNYTRNSGNGYFGAYQYSIGSWGNYDGYARADLAPAAVQDAKAQADQAARGWSPWPACSRRLGLS